MSFFIACRRSVVDAFEFLSSRVVPILVIAALLSPTFFILSSRTVEASEKRSRKNVTAPASAPPEPFIIGGQQSNPILAILAVEAFLTIASSFMAMFADENAEARTSELEDEGGRMKEEAASDSSFIPNPSSFAMPPQPASIVDFDFDNDGKTDIGRWKPATSEFEIDPSNGGANLVYDIGSSTSKFVPGDFNNDGNVDAAVFDSGIWTYKPSPSATPAPQISLGQSGDIPVPANYDGNGATDAAVFRPSNGTWYVKESSTGNTVSTAFGTAGDIPVPGEYDGDGIPDEAVFRPSTGVWHINGSTVGYYGSSWGLSSDVPVPADYDGDGKTDVAVYRGSTGTWYVQKSNGGTITQVWGNYGDQPVPGYYDGNAVADLAVWRPSTGVWYIAKSGGGHEYHTLGVPGDRAVPSAFIKQIGGEVAPYELAKARLSPKNATGGTDLYSQNFSWGTSLVGLPGRAGLNAGFGMSYNSLVWTKEGNNVHFDTNYDNISPGFRFGFPTIEAPYYLNPANEGDPFFSYIMVSPSGARTEFRQIGVTDTFETVDSSYLQLKTETAPDPNTPIEDITLTVRGTDGTQMSYVWIAGAFRCTQILDRNGNYITIDHSEYGQLTKVTDTLGREINVNYSEDLYPTSITQTWKTDNGLGSNVTHTWATLSYANATLNPSWHSSITNTGPPAGTILKVLDKITYPDLSSTKFYYNNYGQVSKIENIAADSSSHILNSVETNLSNPGSSLSDVPRLGETRTFVENFNGGNETVVTNTLATGHQITNIDGATVTATLIQVAMQNHPTGNVANTYVGQSGWMEGLPIVVNDYAAGNGLELKRSSWTKWTQDDVNSADIQNPRVIETKVGDGVNLKLSTIHYLLYPSTTVSQFGLVEETRTYAADQSTVLKRSEIEYNFATAYTDRRIIGLPAEIRTYGWNDVTSTLELGAKITYGYDEEDFEQETNQIISPIRHETAKYGSSFVAGRGNLTSVTRHDVLSQSSAVTSRTRYDIAGSVVSKLDPMGRKVRLEYTDVFNDLSTPGTFAYPTKVFDPAGNFSQVKYRFDTGANVWAKSPAPAGNIDGKETVREYDNKGRLEKEIIVNNGAYTRYEYPPNGIQSKVFSTIIDTNVNGADTADEVLSESWTDGAGRVCKTRTEHPGSIGGYRGTLAEYDILGRVKRSTVPTEIDNNWNTDGDDDRGLDQNNNPIWLWNSKEYDWMGRVTRSVNSDGTDTLTSFEGCGCAGGLVTTIQGELVPRDDQPTVHARRTQKVYADILGRNWKSVDMKWDGTTAYSTTEHKFNGRDQIVLTRQTDNTSTANPQTFQDSTTEYDGHGRTWRTHAPEQRDSSNNPTFTVYAYNSDDSIAAVTDGRGAAASYSHNNLGLTTQVSYTVPQGSSIPVTPTISFSYDNLGNRTQMIDGTGTTTYQLDQLSRIISETKVFTGLSGNFTLDYEYQLNGSVKQLDILPTSTGVTYGYDKIGRVTAVTGQGFTDARFNNAVITDIASDIKYRAWNDLRSMEFGNPASVNIDYNNRLSPSSFTIPNLMEIHYQYNGDGRVKFAESTLNSVTETFNRSYNFDNMGRMTAAKSGAEASGGSNMTGPYRQTYQFDAFSNLTDRSTVHWSETYSYGFSATYMNNRRNGWQYDNDGNMAGVSGTSGPGFGIDTDGQNTVIEQPVEIPDPELCAQTHQKKYLFYDGDGLRAIEHNEMRNYCVYSGGSSHLTSTVDTKKYNLKSTVLGGAVVFQFKTSNIWNNNGSTSSSTSKETRLFLHGKLLASFMWNSLSPSWYPHFNWHHVDPTGNTIGESQLQSGTGFYQRIAANLDPMGADVGFGPPEVPEPPPPSGQRWEFGSPEDVDWITVDGVTAPANHFPAGMLSVASRCPRDDCGPIRTEHGWEYWHAFADGYEGYMPMGGTYAGGGNFQTREQRQRSNQDKKRRKAEKRIKPVLKGPISKAELAAAKARADARSFIDLENDEPEDLLGKYRFFRSLIERRVKFVGDPNGLVMKNKEGLIARLAWLVGLKDCNDIFKKELGRTPYDAISEDGLFITDYGSLENPEYAGIFGFSESERVGLLAHRENVSPDASTIPKGHLPIGIVTIFNEKRINVNWGWQWYYGEIYKSRLDTAVAHEGAHVAGKEPQPFNNPMSRSPNHDLKGWGAYPKVIDKCKIPL